MIQSPLPLPSLSPTRTRRKCVRKRLQQHPPSPVPWVVVPVVQLLLFLLIIIITTCPTTMVQSRELPLHKAIPPLMDPIPILPEITHRIYMDIMIQGAAGEGEGEDRKDTQSTVVGRIVIGLFGTNAPTAAENFRLLSTCTHRKMMVTTTTSTSTTTTTSSGKKKNILCYKDTIFHRIVPNFAIQGGDTTHANGMGGFAAIAMSDHGNTGGNSYQPYMINTTQFNRPYMVAVATPNTQLAKSQFFITTVKAQWLSALQYTIFGMVLEGQNVIRDIERIAGTYGGKPKTTVHIVDCGEIPLLLPLDKEPHY